MNALSRIKSSVIAAFIARSPLRDRFHVLENPTEEILEETDNGKKVKLFMAGSPGARARLEENYLYDTRRFPSYVTGESFPAPLLANEYQFFMNAQGSPAANNGFSPLTTPTMSDIETNMDTPGQVPQGKNFVMTQVGVSFNADIDAVDCATMMESGSLRFSKQGGQFTLRHGKPSLWAGGTGIPQTNTGGVSSNGNPDIRAVRKLAVPRVLGQRDVFAYSYVVPRTYRNIFGITTDNATELTAPVIMTIWLWGGQEDSIPV